MILLSPLLEAVNFQEVFMLTKLILMIPITISRKESHSRKNSNRPHMLLNDFVELLPLNTDTKNVSMLQNSS